MEPTGPRPDDDSPLPVWSSEWMREALGAPVPHEPLSTCANCVMAGPPARRLGEDPYRFTTDVKCCTYLPEVPNFLVGGALRDDDPAVAAGRETLRRRIANAEAVTPLGVQKTDDFLTRYRLDTPVFGRDPSLRCPHFLVDTGRCGIWRYRESTCSTWHCKHVRGAVGQTFWNVLRELLREVEEQLAWWCVGRLGLQPGKVARLATSARPAHDRTQDIAAAWGAWGARREEYYIRCAQEVDAFTWPQVESVFAGRLPEKLANCRAAFARLQDDSIPVRVRVGSFEVLGRDEELTRVTTHSRFDPLDLPNTLVRLLPAFDGRPTGEALDRIAREGGSPPDPATVRRLVDFGVLERVPDETDV